MTPREELRPRQNLWKEPQYRRDVDRLRELLASRRWNVAQLCRDTGTDYSVARQLIGGFTIHPDARFLYPALAWLANPRAFSAAERSPDAWLGFAPEYAHRAYEKSIQHIADRGTKYVGQRSARYQATLQARRNQASGIRRRGGAGSVAEVQPTEGGA
jgi:hypothetical protein